MPDNAYGNHPPVEIERDLQQGGDPNQDQKPTNEEDLGDLYSAKFFNCILASAAPAFNIPKQYKDVTKLSTDEQRQWRTAMQEEMDSLQDRKVWDLVNLPPGRTPVKGRWVYVVKSDGQHKAHFVAKGFTQTTRRLYQERHGEQSLSFEEGHLWSQTSHPSVEQGFTSISIGDGICSHTFRPRNLCSLSWSGYYHSCHLC